MNYYRLLVVAKKSWICKESLWQISRNYKENLKDTLSFLGSSKGLVQKGLVQGSRSGSRTLVVIAWDYGDSGTHTTNSGNKLNPWRRLGNPGSKQTKQKVDVNPKYEMYAFRCVHQAIGANTIGWKLALVCTL